MDNKKYYTYKEAQEKIEKAIKNSGVRRFCSDICKGDCCSSCSKYEEDPKACRKLSCSSFICIFLQEIIFSGEANKEYRRLMWALTDMERKFLSGGNAYFVGYKALAQARKGMKVPCEIVDRIVKYLGEAQVRNRMRSLHTLTQQITERH